MKLPEKEINNYVVTYIFFLTIILFRSTWSGSLLSDNRKAFRMAVVKYFGVKYL